MVLSIYQIMSIYAQNYYKEFWLTILKMSWLVLSPVFIGVESLLKMKKVCSRHFWWKEESY